MVLLWDDKPQIHNSKCKKLLFINKTGFNHKNNKITTKLKYTIENLFKNATGLN